MPKITHIVKIDDAECEVVTTAHDVTLYREVERPDTFHVVTGSIVIYSLRTSMLVRIDDFYNISRPVEPKPPCPE